MLASAESQAHFTRLVDAALEGLSVADLVLAATRRCAHDPRAPVWLALREGDPSVLAVEGLPYSDYLTLGRSRGAVDFAATAPLAVTFFGAVPAGELRPGRSGVLLQVHTEGAPAQHAWQVDAAPWWLRPAARAGTAQARPASLQPARDAAAALRRLLSLGSAPDASGSSDDDDDDSVDNDARPGQGETPAVGCCL